MKVEYKYGNDLGKPNWRVYCHRFGVSNISFGIENFDTGFKDGESWDKVYPSKADVYQNEYASVITKDKDKIETYRPLVIQRFREILKYNITHHSREIKRIETYITRCNESLSSDLFVDIIRNDKLSDLGI